MQLACAAKLEKDLKRLLDSNNGTLGCSELSKKENFLDEGVEFYAFHVDALRALHIRLL